MFSETINAIDKDLQNVFFESSKFGIYSNIESNVKNSKLNKSLLDVYELISYGTQNSKDLYEFVKSDGYDAKEYSKKKGNVICTIFSADFKDRKKPAEKATESEKQTHFQTQFVGYNYLIQLDFDKLAKEHTQKIIDVAKQLDYIALSFRSPSKNPKLIALWKPSTPFNPKDYIESERNHKNAFFALRARAINDIHELTLIDIDTLKNSFDTNTKDLKRLCILSYDPNAYLNVNAIPIELNSNIDYIEKKPLKVSSVNANSNVSSNEKIFDGIKNAKNGERHKQCFLSGLKASRQILLRNISESDAISEAETVISKVYANDGNKRYFDGIQNFKNGIESGKNTSNILPISDENDNEFFFTFCGFDEKKIEIHYSEIRKYIAESYTGLTKLFSKIYQSETNFIYVTSEDFGTVLTNSKDFYFLTYNSKLGYYEQKDYYYLQNFLETLKQQIDTFLIFVFSQIEREKRLMLNMTNNKQDIEAKKHKENISKLKSIANTFDKAKFYDNLANTNTQITNQIVVQYAKDYVKRVNELDKTPHYIATNAGVINLFNPSQSVVNPRRYLITSKVNASYNPNAKTAFWEDHFGKMFSGQIDLQNSVLHYIYLTLCGVTTDEILWLCGNGRNGKTTLFKGLALLFGKHSAPFNSEHFFQKNSNANNKDTFDIEQIENKKLVLVEEMNAKSNGKKDVAFLDVSLLKKITGSGFIQNRKLYGRPYTLKKTANFIFSANKLPKHYDESDATFKRIQIVSLDYDFTKDGKHLDSQTLDGLIESNLDGLLTMIINAGLECSTKKVEWSEATTQSNLDYQKENKRQSFDDIEKIVATISKKYDENIPDDVSVSIVKSVLGNLYPRNLFDGFEKKRKNGGVYFTSFKNDLIRVSES